MWNLSPWWLLVWSIDGFFIRSFIADTTSDFLEFISVQFTFSTYLINSAHRMLRSFSGVILYFTSESALWQGLIPFLSLLLNCVSAVIWVILIANNDIFAGYAALIKKRCTLKLPFLWWPRFNKAILQKRRNIYFYNSSTNTPLSENTS